jgi:hypothetical protein
MPVIRGIPVLLLASLLVVACQNNSSQSSAPTNTTSSTQGIEVVADTSVEATVQSHVSTMWCGEGLSGTYLSSANFLYRYENCDEVLETLEVTGIKKALDDSGNTVSAAFLRYSIGTKVFREVLRFRQVGDRYAQTGDRPTTYSDEEDWNPEALKLAEEADNWEEESAEWYE